MTNLTIRSSTRLFQKIFLIILGIFLAAALLEAGLRLGGFIILSAQEHRNTLSARDKSAYRVLCVGESTTRNQYPPFLEQILNQRSKGVSFSIIDKGLGGTNTSTIVNNIEKYLADYKPDMVVAMMGINDFGAHMPLELPTSSKALLFIRSLKTYKLSRLLWLHITTRIKEVKSSQPPKEPLKFDFQDAGYYKKLEDVYREQGKLFPAEDSFKKAIALNPNDAGYYKNLGWAYDEQGKLFLAEDSFKKAIALNPNDSGCYAGLGAVYHEQGKLSLAEDTFKKGLALNPNDSVCYAGLGWVYREQVNFSLAEDSFNKGLALNPDYAGCYAGLGFVYHDQGKLSLAEDRLKKASELNPDDSDCYAELGAVYHEQGKLSLAEETLKKGLALNPKMDIICSLLALVYEEEGKMDLAKEYYRKADEIRGNEYNIMTAHNYLRLKEILDNHNVRLICVQYPMRSVDSLERVFGEDNSGIIFVSNEQSFKEGVRKEGYKAYFLDMFAGEFGHCTDKGNYLLAENIAEAILKKASGRQH